MARAARGTRRKAARLGLLSLAGACAAAQEPPGGPPDFTAPTLVAVRPDSGTAVPGFREAAVFEFDEVINERSGGKLEDLFTLSPRHERVEVSWKRTRIEIRPRGGWRPETIYEVRMLPGVMDLRNNRLRESVALRFSTGPPIPETRLGGTVVNWAAGRIAARALVEAIAEAGQPDSLVYFTVADSTGEYLLQGLPPGTYLLVATADENGNRRRDRREAFDSVRVQLDSVDRRVFWAFVHDTVGPQLRSATRVDSLAVRLEFSQSLQPGAPAVDAVSALLLPDSTPVAIGAVLLPAVFDSLRAAAAAAAARDSAAAADTAAAPRPPDQPPAARRPGIGRAQPRSPEPAAPDTGRVASLLRERPALGTAWIVQLDASLLPGARYLFRARASNVNGAVAESRTVLAVPDTTATGQ